MVGSIDATCVLGWGESAPTVSLRSGTLPAGPLADSLALARGAVSSLILATATDTVCCEESALVPSGDMVLSDSEWLPWGSGFSRTILHSPCASAVAIATFVPPVSRVMVQPGWARPASTPSPFGSTSTTSKLGTVMGLAGCATSPVAAICGCDGASTGADASGFASAEDATGPLSVPPPCPVDRGGMSPCE